MKTRLEQLARPVIGLALFGGFVLAFSGWAGVYSAGAMLSTLHFNPELMGKAA